ncbi:MAG: TatD family hydrolase [Rhodothermia bacterium]|nr:MAG: TatD family hydrolase [Rhodothermia bacterium]
MLQDDGKMSDFLLIDTHAHIYLEQFAEDLEDVIVRARNVGVEKIVMPAIDIPSIHQALELCNRFQGLYAMAAIHPSETKSASEVDFDQVRSLCRNVNIVAIGESGLDYYWDRSFDETQQQFLRLHARLAISENLPLILHNREAADDIIRILREEKEQSEHPEKLGGIFHCFGGPSRVVSEILDLGFHFGIGGTLTFKNAGVPDAIKDIPIESIVLETDAPFLAPVPYRGKRNEPSHVRLVAERLAEVRGLTLEEVAEITTQNAKRLFAQD